MTKALAIKDLPANQELDRAAQTTVRGAGNQSNAATNSINQVLNSNTIVGNDSVFNGSTVFNVDANHTQSASIFNTQFNLDGVFLGASLGHLNLSDFFLD